MRVRVFLIIGLVRVVALVPLGFQISSADPKAENESDKGRSGEDSEWHGFAFRFDARCEREQAAGDEGAHGTASRGESLSQAVEGTKNRMVGSRVGDLCVAFVSYATLISGRK